MLLLQLMVLVGIYMYMLFQGAAGNCVVPHIPELFFRSPLPTCRLDLCPQGHVRGCDVKGVQEYPAFIIPEHGANGLKQVPPPVKPIQDVVLDTAN